MKFQLFQFLPRYFSEATVVFLSILLSFYFEDLRITKEKNSYKNELVVDMQKIIDLELNQLNNIRNLQNRCLVAGEELLSDLLSQNQSLTDREIAERLLLLMQRGTVSFFAQNGIYEELKSTGSTELIKSKNFRYALSDTYNNLFQRNLAVSRIIDDYFFNAISRINKKIIIISKEKKDEGYVYSELVPTFYKIDKEYYRSDGFLSDVNQMKSLVERYLDLISALDKSYNDLKIYSQEELSL